jgi:hypothetical protein
MALYKDAQHLRQISDMAFDQLHGPGVAAPFAGIYKCAGCGHEIAIAYGHTLPPQSHAQHPPGKPIQWRLLVFAQHNA